MRRRVGPSRLFGRIVEFKQNNKLILCVAERLRVPARDWRDTFREFLAVDFSAELSRIAAPALILAGGRDTFSRRQERDALAAALRQRTTG